MSVLAIVMLIQGMVYCADESSGSTQVTPKAETTDSSSAIDQLMAQLPHVNEVVRRDDLAFWEGGGVSLPILDMSGRDLVVGTIAGHVVIPRRLVEAHRTSDLAQILPLADIAKHADMASTEYTFEDGILVGPSLRTTDTEVVAQGVLRQQSLPPVDRDGEIHLIGEAVKRLRTELGTTGLDAIGQNAFEDMLNRLDRTDGGQAPDEVLPSFARRVVRQGWLRQWFREAAGAAAAADVERAIVAAEQPRAVTLFVGGPLRLEKVADAFGRGGWIWRRGDRVLYAHPEAAPEYLVQVPELTSVVELPDGADPAINAHHALAARLFAGNQALASWSVDDGFHADQQRWNAKITAHGRDLVSHALPPHIVIADLHGDIAGLAVAGGLLRPVEDDSRSSAERFIADASKMLPDAAHLDLIGEYLFTYVYPSPDAKHPELLGTKQAKGNVQQTVWQTCGNVCGGVMHGDCADIAELYHTIVSAQGRNPIVIGLPEHAACAWAERGSDRWKVNVLQTGPPLSFSDQQLPVCLGKAYTSFDPSMAFDPNQVPLLLRFSGEVSRSSWSLSWRIFSDPTYATTMFDVQRDWHFQTYQRGIATMKKMIADGDHDNANYRELAGLYSFTGQYDLAADYHRQAMALTSDPINHLTMSIELIGHLVNAHKTAEAVTLATDILDTQLPALKSKLGDVLPRIALDFAVTCLNDQGGPALRALAARALKDTIRDQFATSINRLSLWLAGPQFNEEAWDNDTGFRAQRSLLGEYVGVIISLLDADGSHQLPGNDDTQALTSAAQRWLEGVAFHDIEEDSAVMARYALAGEWYATVVGEAAFDQMLDDAKLPNTSVTKVDHAKRGRGAEQMQRDLPWIRASVPYWFGRLAKVFQRDHASLNSAAVARLATRLSEAHAATVALGLSEPFVENRAELAHEIAALIARDLPALRHALHRVAESNDKDLRDDAAMWLGDVARFLPPEWYAQVLNAWVEEVDYKPKYFWIAWRAALNDAPQQALMAAKVAADRFTDDAAFAEEYGFMRALLEPRSAATAGPTAIPVKDQAPEVVVP